MFFIYLFFTIGVLAVLAGLVPGVIEVYAYVRACIVTFADNCKVKLENRRLKIAEKKLKKEEKEIKKECELKEELKTEEVVVEEKTEELIEEAHEELIEEVHEVNVEEVHEIVEPVEKADEVTASEDELETK